jgi:hypothetical protein
MTQSLPFKVLVGTVVLAAVLAILQMWFMVFSWDIFIKILGTLGIIFLLVGFLMAVGSDMGNKKNLKDQNYLD